ncbi:MAG: type transport system ATP-binding protein [Clostridiales bacterium]|nr:type transport system ATP-binding protein [Clostridiales bacterium]
MSETILKMNHITKAYKKKVVLKDVSITINRGDIYGLVGNNGAGKTTLMRMICGLAFPDEGSIELFQKTSKKERDRERCKMGTLIEDPGFYGNMTAYENLEYFRIQFGVPGNETVKKVLREVHLEDTGKKRYKNFSMGMKQRLGIALALLQTPQFLILDEPINGLDPSGIIEVRNTLLELNQKKNTTILISSHILAEMSNIATKYGFLSHGILKEEITADELLKKCNSYLDITVKDTKAMSVILEEQFSYQNFKIYPDHHIHLYEGIDRTEEICEAAVQHHVGLSGVEKKVVNLENYYMNMVEVG